MLPHARRRTVSPSHADKESIQMPTGTTSDPIHHSFPAPPFENATVVDAMRMGVVSCPPDTPIREVARIMATYRIHCVVVAEVAGAHPWA